MKKLLFTLLFAMISICSFAQVYKYQTTELAIKTQNSRGNWGDWSDWEDCSCLVVINLDKDKITIYSKERQEYDVYECDDPYEDSDGDTVIKMKAVDQDGDNCTVRLIIRKSGQTQLYVDFNNVMWVYNIEEK